ncbi:MAG: tyrosine-protein phosphatase [Thermoguttaceae bacterium]
MSEVRGLVDIHCHLLPGIDDGPPEWSVSLETARALVAQGVSSAIVTPHQLGAYPNNRGETIRQRTAELQDRLASEDVPLRVLPGAEIHIEATLLPRLASGQLLTLADRGRHVLVEMPEAVFLPPGRLVAELKAAGMVVVLAHPERNRGAMGQPELLAAAVRDGCLLQVTAGSLSGLFGNRVQAFAESLVRRGLVRFVASDAHGPQGRASALRPAYLRVVQWIGEKAAGELFSADPSRIAAGSAVASGRRSVEKSGWGKWFARKIAA